MQRWPETKRLLGLLVNSAGARARAQRAPAGAGGAQAGSPPLRRAAGGLAGAHAGGPAGARRRADADGPQALGPGARAAPELPEGQAPARRPPPAAQEVRRRGHRGPEVDASAATVDAQATTATGLQPDDEDLIVDADAGLRGRGRRRARRGLSAQRSRCTSPACQRHAARAGVHEQGAALVDAGGRPLAAAPAHLGPAQRVAAAPLRQHLGQRRREPLVQSPEQGREHLARWSAARAARRPARWRSPAARAGSVRRRGHVQADAEHGPPLLRPALHEDPGELAAVHQHVVGPLDRGSRPAPPRPPPPPPPAAPTRAAGAAPPTAARREPGAATQPRPWRPRPAVCSSAVTTVPCGAPPSASALARSLVESTERWWTAGRADHRGRRRTSASGSTPSIAAASPRFTASASVR